MNRMFTTVHVVYVLMCTPVTHLSFIHPHAKFQLLETAILYISQRLCTSVTLSNINVSFIVELIYASISGERSSSTLISGHVLRFIREYEWKCCDRVNCTTRIDEEFHPIRTFSGECIYGALTMRFSFRVDPTFDLYNAAHRTEG